MRRLLAASIALFSLAFAAPSAGALVPADGPTAGGFATDNFEYVTHIPLANDTAGARIFGKYMYLTTGRGLNIYDISDPEAPALTGTAVLPQTPYFGEEDPDTNGKILLLNEHVVDVEDKSNPVAIATHDADQHTISCILDCTYAYGSGGAILDLRQPTKPKVVGDWTKFAPPVSGTHDVTEIKPGLVMTSTNPLVYLDARKDPTKPKVLAMAGTDDGSYMHANLWPRSGKERFLLVGSETPGPQCGPDAGAFMTWDTKNWEKTRTFKLTDTYRVENGLYTDGNSPANLFCAHWFETHPKYRNGGLVAMAWYEHGTRLFDISSQGKITEAGYFIPYGGSTSAAYWANDEILYSVDYNRGLDVLRYTGKV
jgi:hypothetical protein